MKTIFKIGIAVAGVAAVGFLAWQGVKRLKEKALDQLAFDDCDCCDCGEDCNCGCECECHKKEEKPAEAEPVVEAKEEAVPAECVEEAKEEA